MPALYHPGWDIGGPRESEVENPPIWEAGVCYGFLQRDSIVFEQVDDSSGYIGDAFRGASKVFVEAALSAKDRERLYSATLDCIRDNGYGARDPIHAACGRFLKEDELASLLEALRTDWLQAPESEFSPTEAFRYTHAAYASGDPELYRKVLLEVQKGELKDYDHIRLAQLHCLRKNWETALELIADIPVSPAWKRDIEAIRIQAFEATGRNADIVDLRKKSFLAHPSPHAYDAWQQSVSPDERSAARSEAIETAMGATGFPVSVLELLFHLSEAAKAAEYVMAHADRISGSEWHSLPTQAAAFEKAGYPAAATLLLRKLLEDILENARSSAYRHAVRYWKALDRMADSVDLPAPNEAPAAYKARMTLLHKRKTSFWSKVG